MGTHEQSKLENLQYQVDQLTRENERLKADIAEMTQRLIDRTDGFMRHWRKSNLTTVQPSAKHGDL